VIVLMMSGIDHSRCMGRCRILHCDTGYCGEGCRIVRKGCHIGMCAALLGKHRVCSDLN